MTETKAAPLCLFASGLTEIDTEEDVCVLSDDSLRLANRIFHPQDKDGTRQKVVYDDETSLYVVKLGAIAGPGTVTFLQRNLDSGTVRLAIIFPANKREDVQEKLADGKFYQSPVLWQGLQTLGGWRAHDIYHELKRLGKRSRVPDPFDQLSLFDALPSTQEPPSKAEQAEFEVWKMSS